MLLMVPSAPKNITMPLCILLDLNSFYKFLFLANHKPRGPTDESINLMRMGIMHT